MMDIRTCFEFIEIFLNKKKAEPHCDSAVVYVGYFLINSIYSAYLRC